MASFTFALVLTVVSDDAGNAVPGPFNVNFGPYFANLKPRLSQYWDEMSGGRVQVNWAPDVQLTVMQTMKQWEDLKPRDRIAQARAQARSLNLIPDGTEVIVIANDADKSPRAVTPSDSSPYVHVSFLTAGTVAHEMGHFFEWRGSRKAGHADVARNFFRDEYADRTCIMGGAGSRFSFQDASIAALSGVPTATRSGPRMNPALVDQSGWLDMSSPLVAVINPVALGQVTLQPWRGAPRANASGGAPVVAILDGRALDDGRLYMCIREANGWDRGFASPWLTTLGGQPHRQLCVYLSTPSGDSLLLASGSATPGPPLVLGRVPLRVTVAGNSPEGVTIRVEESPWRGSYALEGVQCAPAAQIATAAWGTTADAYVIDAHGKVRYNHFNGHGWEYKQLWKYVDGDHPPDTDVTCDMLGGIAAVARHGGLVEVFVTDLSGTVHRMQRRGGTWSPAWQKLPGGGLGPHSSLAATRIDDDRVLLCGVRPDGQVSRVEVGDAGTLGSWVSAPQRGTRRRPRPMSHVAATPDDAARGRIYAVAVSDPDRSVWATPDLASPDPRFWGAVGTLRFEGGRPLAATKMLGAREVVIVGTDPIGTNPIGTDIVLLAWSGTDWVVEDQFGPMQRDPTSGLAVMSRVDESLDILYIDSTGTVQVSPWSRRKDFAPAWNQYDSVATVVLQAATGHFVRAANGGGDGMGADGGVIGEWERLVMRDCQTVIINAGETRRLVVFQTRSGHYVGAVGGGGSHVIAEAVQAGPWETFYLEELPGFLPGIGPVTIRCINESHYWSAVDGGGGALAADKSEPKEWEKFILMEVQ